MAKTGESQTGSVSFLSGCKEKSWSFPFGYFCSIKSPLLVIYNLHVNTRYELVNINVYIAYNAFENTIYITMRLSCKIANGSIKSVICNVNIVFNF